MSRSERNPMDHPRIEEERILDSYLAGRLSEEEEALFEEHLFECSTCFEAAQVGEELRRGVRAVAAEEAALVELQAKVVGLRAWWRGRPRAATGLSVVLALALFVPFAAVLWQQGELHREYREARAALERTPVEASFDVPSGELQLISLGVLRDAGAEPAVIQPLPATEALLLSLELPSVTAPRYRVTLWNAAGERIWQGEDVEPNLYETLMVAVPPDFLEAGMYRVTVEPGSANNAGTENPASRWEVGFRIEKQDSDR